MEQEELLTTANLTLAPNIKQSDTKDDILILKNESTQSYLSIARAQHKTLHYFKSGSNVAEVLPKLISSSSCPPLRNFYELILQAVEANILQKENDDSKLTPALNWPISINEKVILILSIISFIIGILGLIKSGITLPQNTLDVVLSYAITCGCLSLGYLIAASVLKGYQCEVYKPHFHWLSFFPHFQVDLSDSIMSNRMCQLNLSLSRIAPLLFAIGICGMKYPQFNYVILLGLFYSTWPLGNSAAINLISVYFKKFRISTSHDFLFVQNKLLTTILSKKIIHTDIKYLLIYALYFIIWLGLLLLVQVYIFQINAEELVPFFDKSKEQIGLNKFIIFSVIISVIALSVSTGIWLLAKNIAAYFRSKNTNKIKKNLPDNISDVNPTAIEKALSKTLLFKDSSDDVRKKITKVIKASEYKPKSFVFKEGETGEELYIIYSGRVEILRELNNGRYVKITELTEGDAFGEIALLQNIPRTRSIRAIKPTILLTLSRTDFDNLVVTILGENKIKEIIQIRAFLMSLPMCKNWHPQAIQRFAELSNLIEINENQEVLKQDKENLFFYMVYEGTFEVRKDGKKVATIKKGDFFGEISLLKNSASNADVTAKQVGKCLILNRKDFLKFISHDFFVGLQFEKISSKRLKQPIFQAPPKD